MTDCKNAEDLAAFAREHGWHAETRDDTQDGDPIVVLQLTGVWGDPDDLDWQWGVQLAWFKTAKSWKLGTDVHHHPALGIYIGRDEVEREFWMRSMRIVRQHIEDSAGLVARFEEWHPEAKNGPTTETRISNVMRRIHDERMS